MPGLWFARRLTAAEARAAAVSWMTVLDPAAEFPKAHINARNYYSLPPLDGAAPRPADLKLAAAYITEQLKRGPVLVHCALGHGRSGAVVLTWLMTYGHSAELPEGVAKLRSLRGSFGIDATQLQSVERASAART